MKGKARTDYGSTALQYFFANSFQIEFSVLLFSQQCGIENMEIHRRNTLDTLENVAKDSVVRNTSNLVADFKT